MNKTLLIASLSVILILACATPSAVVPTANPGAIQTAIVQTANAAATQTAFVIQPTVTNTPIPIPTDTPLPPPTSTAPPQPIVLTGSGDSVVDFQKWDGPAIVKIKHTGGGNFAVRNYPANSADYYDLMVNTIGSYEGTRPLDFKNSQHTARFEIFAGGQWELQVLPIDGARSENVPGTIQGKGDDVVFLKGSPDVMKADASQGSGNFAIQALNSSSMRLTINEIAPYTGTVILDPTTFLLIITATGPWSLEITGK